MEFNNLEADFLRNKLQSAVTFIEKEGNVPEAFYTIVESELREAIKILDSISDAQKYNSAKIFLRGLIDLFLQMTLIKNQPNDKIKRNCKRYLAVLEKINN